MVKLGTVRFKGKCERHTGFDPYDGPGGIKGGCKRCQLLLEIHDAHARLTELIRKAKNEAPETMVRRAAASAAVDKRQATLF
ncbi:MAG: hypothetical protein JNM66_19950 [Bryobacterales bacterium]|nr:hypothetical protein [Bryobacterales bacterium]